MALGSQSLVEFQAGESLNDITGVAFVLAAVALLVNGYATPRPAATDHAGRAIVPAALAVAGIAAGLAAGTKLSFLAPVAALTVAVVVIAPAAGRLRAAALWGIPMLAAGGYWYARNLIAVGNPIPYVGSLGPISLPAPVRDFQLRPDFAVVHYWNDTDVWRDWFGPGLDDSFGTLWPLTLAAMIAVAVLALWRGREPILRALGALVAVTAIAYVFTPLTAAGEEGQPISFVWNVRYLAPAVAVGLAILPCLPLLRATPRRRAARPRRAHGAARVHGGLAGAVGAGPHQGRRGGRRAGGRRRRAGLGPALARRCSARPHPGASRPPWWPPRSGAPSPPATPSRTTTSPTGTRTPARCRTSTTRCAGRGTCATRESPSPASVACSRSTPSTAPTSRIGCSGSASAARTTPTGGSPTAASGASAIDAGGYTHVVTTFDPYLPGEMRNSPEGRWTQAKNDPNARIVLRDGPVRVFELRGPLDPAGCAGQRPLTEAQLHSVPNLSGTSSKSD